jgi:hypothetical protein
MAALAPLLPVISVVGTTVAVGGQIMGAIAAKNQADYEAAIADRNAEAARLQAQEDAARFRVDTRRRLASTRAAFGASGLILEGSPIDLLGDAAVQGELDALTIEHGGRVRAQAFGAEAEAASMRGTASLIGGFGRASDTLLGGIARHKEHFS